LTATEVMQLTHTYRFACSYHQGMLKCLVCGWCVYAIFYPSSVAVHKKLLTSI